MSKPVNFAAFPYVMPDGGGEDGMTLRDWFAGQALAGLCANRSQVDSGADAELRGAAMQAYVTADAMLAERERGQ